MKNYFEAIKKCPLFTGMEEKEVTAVMTCFEAKEHPIQKDEILLRAGEQAKNIGVVLSGSVYVVQEDYWGSRTILSTVEAGGIFAESFSCAKEALPVSVLAHSDGSVLFLNCHKLMAPCSSCAFHTKVIQNLMWVLANKNIGLTKKIKHITKKTTREKVLSYLSECAAGAGTNCFEIPFNRQELADYLSVERSALSNTLCKMRDEGLLRFHKNEFELM